MLSWSAISGFSGGLGLFLLGMWLLTEGLKLGGGSALSRILASWTTTRLRSFLSGFSLTAVVQSSSAVTVAVIGFINAGLLDMSRSLWVVFGSNVGTTMTAWIVAIVGFKFKVDAFALPAVGIGALLHLFSTGVRFRSAGGALAGFGLLLLGLQILQGAFSSLEHAVDLSAFSGKDASSIALMLLLGLLLTAVMQSSSAAMAIVLTAVATETVTIAAGAAAVIGANVGTTVTALLAVLKATANARRVAVAHMLFNVITATVALIVLAPFIGLIAWFQLTLNMDPNPAISLALFHTAFNLLGVALMIPLEPRITARLKRLFTRGETQTTRMQYLDGNILRIPDLALNATGLEQSRILGEIATLIRQFRQGVTLPNAAFAELRAVLSDINEAIVECSKQALPGDIAEAFRKAIEANIHASNCLDNLRAGAKLPELENSLSQPQKDMLATFFAHGLNLANYYEAAVLGAAGATDDRNLPEDFESSYDDMRKYIVSQGQQQHLSSRTMESLLQELSLFRRMIRQYVKACRTLGALRQDKPTIGEQTYDH
ncbi:MAG TPA: Na/Pi-cotransporter II-like protein [Porticoccaceae bacterium]|nr:Na/Pi-cotransporter II-like protein [Porticoccaceae bacterium]